MTNLEQRRRIDHQFVPRRITHELSLSKEQQLTKVREEMAAKARNDPEQCFWFSLDDPESVHKRGLRATRKFARTTLNAVDRANKARIFIRLSLVPHEPLHDGLHIDSATNNGIDDKAALMPGTEQIWHQLWNLSDEQPRNLLVSIQPRETLEFVNIDGLWIAPAADPARVVTYVIPPIKHGVMSGVSFCPTEVPHRADDNGLSHCVGVLTTGAAI
jgi:hypothetical protein